jgi:hypothetical protein
LGELKLCHALVRVLAEFVFEHGRKPHGFDGGAGRPYRLAASDTRPVHHILQSFPVSQRLCGHPNGPSPRCLQHPVSGIRPAPRRHETPPRLSRHPPSSERGARSCLRHSAASHWPHNCEGGSQWPGCPWAPVHTSGSGPSGRQIPRQTSSVGCRPQPTVPHRLDAPAGGVGYRVPQRGASFFSRQTEPL